MKTTNEEMRPLYGISPDDAVDMLIADHKRVANLFADFKRLADEGRDKDKAAIVQRICQELTVHTQLEEELFYPAVRDATGDKDQVDEAVVEHAGAKQLIAQLQGASPDEDLYDARVTVLNEQIDHHVDEEEGSMFPKARYSGLDTLALGAKMLARKAQLQRGAGSAGNTPAPSKTSSDEDDLDDDGSASRQLAPTKAKAAAAKVKASKAKSSGKPKRR